MTSKSGVVLLNVMGFFCVCFVVFLYAIANLFGLNDFSWLVEMKQIYFGFYKLEIANVNGRMTQK